MRKVWNFFVGNVIILPSYFFYFLFVISRVWIYNDGLVVAASWLGFFIASVSIRYHVRACSKPNCKRKFGYFFACWVCLVSVLVGIAQASASIGKADYQFIYWLILSATALLVGLRRFHPTEYKEHQIANV